MNLPKTRIDARSDQARRGLGGEGGTFALGRDMSDKIVVADRGYDE